MYPQFWRHRLPFLPAGIVGGLETGSTLGRIWTCFVLTIMGQPGEYSSSAEQKYCPHPFLVDPPSPRTLKSSAYCSHHQTSFSHWPSHRPQAGKGPVQQVSVPLLLQSAAITVKYVFEPPLIQSACLAILDRLSRPVLPSACLAAWQFPC